jgi:hypothetical protein
VLALAACDDAGPVQPLSHSAAMFWCGPADGAATVIVLANEPVQSPQPLYPSVFMMILDDVSALPGRTLSVTGDSAGATYIVNPGQSESAISGSVTITSVDSAQTVKGSVSLRFPSRVVEMQFTAPWIESLMLCG